jgi:hypothetical protein
VPPAGELYSICKDQGNIYRKRYHYLHDMIGYDIPIRYIGYTEIIIYFNKYILLQIEVKGVN